ncbi:MAG: hypothetical protein U5L04_13455 [Trueperaceae bacterium]|nr:hypothetical protein [Trueperaceae bacterium]
MLTPDTLQPLLATLVVVAGTLLAVAYRDHLADVPFEKLFYLFVALTSVTILLLNPPPLQSWTLPALVIYLAEPTGDLMRILLVMVVGAVFFASVVGVGFLLAALFRRPSS